MGNERLPILARIPNQQLLAAGRGGRGYLPETGSDAVTQ